jgi:hypothetical protein
MAGVLSGRERLYKKKSLDIKSVGEGNSLVDPATLAVRPTRYHVDYMFALHSQSVIGSVVVR